MKQLSASLAVFCCAVAAPAASFQNLDFESANTNNLVRPFFNEPNTGFSVFGDIVPGWQVRASTLAGPLTMGWLNGSALADGVVSIFDANNWPTREPQNRFPVYGNFSFAMNPTRSIPFSISQFGDIPVGTKELTFISFGLLPNVFVNNQAIGLKSERIDAGPSDAARFLVTADISEFSGKEVELKFEARYGSSPLGPWVGLDSISFLPVPEPSTWSLVTIGFTVTLGNYFRQKKRA